VVENLEFSKFFNSLFYLSSIGDVELLISLCIRSNNNFRVYLYLIFINNYVNL
jgi:hypothetical protein